VKNLILVGASGFGKEVLWLAERVGRKVIGFLDDTPEKQGSSVLGKPVLGQVSSWEAYHDCEFVVAIGSPRGRKLVVDRMEQTGTPVFATLVDPSSLIGKDVEIRPGTIVCAGAICTVSITIGAHVIININTTIGHESIVGDYCTLAPNVSISGNVTLEPLVEVGTGAKIREKLQIGWGGVVGMGSVVTKNIDSRTVVVGNPARVMRLLA